MFSWNSSGVPNRLSQRSRFSLCRMKSGCVSMKAGSAVGGTGMTASW